MHRKYLKGKRNNKERQANIAGKSKMVQSDIPQVPEFLSRVANIPVVHTAIDYASDAYGKAKDSSPSLIKKTWSTAEDTVNYAARIVLPVVHTLEKPIHAVDALACKTLDKVEETLPVVTKTPEEIITSTRTYVNDKLQPVQAGVSSAVGIVSGATDKLLNNSLGRLTLNSVEFTVATVHDYIDYFIPPLTGEKGLESPPVPSQPSQKIMWTVRRSFDAMIKVQNRLLARTQKALHDQALNALVAIGSLVDLLGWAMANGKELMVKGVPAKVHEIAMYYRGSADGDRKGKANFFDDIMFLIGYFANRCVEYIRGAINSIMSIPESQPILALRLQLSVALAVMLDFTARVIRTLTSDNLMEKADQFLQTDYPLIHQALVTAKSLVFSPTKEKSQ